MGECDMDGCTVEATVMVNGRRACLEHLEEVMAAAFAPIRKIAELLSREELE